MKKRISLLSLLPLLLSACAPSGLTKAARLPEAEGATPSLDPDSLLTGISGDLSVTLDAEITVNGSPIVIESLYRYDVDMPALSTEYAISYRDEDGELVPTETGEATYFRGEAGIAYEERLTEDNVVESENAGFLFNLYALNPFARIGKEDLTPNSDGGYDIDLGIADYVVSRLVIHLLPGLFGAFDTTECSIGNPDGNPLIKGKILISDALMVDEPIEAPFEIGLDPSSVEIGHLEPLPVPAENLPLEEALAELAVSDFKTVIETFPYSSGYSSFYTGLFTEKAVIMQDREVEDFEISPYETASVSILVDDSLSVVGLGYYPADGHPWYQESGHGPLDEEKYLTALRPILGISAASFEKDGDAYVYNGDSSYPELLARFYPSSFYWNDYPAIPATGLYDPFRFSVLLDGEGHIGEIEIEQEGKAIYRQSFAYDVGDGLPLGLIPGVEPSPEHSMEGLESIKSVLGNPARSAHYRVSSPFVEDLVTDLYVDFEGEKILSLLPGGGSYYAYDETASSYRSYYHHGETADGSLLVYPDIELPIADFADLLQIYPYGLDEAYLIETGNGEILALPHNSWSLGSDVASYLPEPLLNALDPFYEYDLQPEDSMGVAFAFDEAGNIASIAFHRASGYRIEPYLEIEILPYEGLPYPIEII